jgi:CHAT domain-containing protein/tetratricopeptide (TPR) repeat protein
LHIELATALASAKLYDQAQSELERGVKAFLSQGQKTAAAEGYATVSGVLISDTSEQAEALQLKCLMSSASMYHDSHADWEEASVLVALGDYYLKVSQAKQSVESYTKAFDMAQNLKRDDIAAQALFGLGNSARSSGNVAQANGYYQRAATLFHSQGNAASEAFCLTNLAKNYAALGDAEKALSTFQQARSTVASLPAINKYFLDYWLGDFYRSQGQFEDALQVYKEAVDLTTKAGDLEHSAYSHLAIGSSEGDIGDWEEAVNEIETARRLFEQLNNKWGQALCWSELVRVYSDRESSLKDFDRAQECYRKAKDLDPTVISSSALGEIYLQTGRYMDAQNAANELIRSCEKDGDTTCQAHGLLSLAEARWHSGDLKGARSAVDQVPALVAKSPNLYLRGRMLYGQARLLVKENRLAEALASYKDLIDLIEQTKGRLDSKDQRALSETYGYIYDELVFLLYRMSQADPTHLVQLGSEALEYAEINKARQFAESWGRVFVGRMKGTLPADLRENERTLFARRDHLVAQLDISADSIAHLESSDRKHLEADLSSTQDEIRNLLKRLREVAPQYAAVAYPEPVQISQLPLRQGETLVEFKMTDDATFAWIIHDQNGTNVLTSFYKISRPRTWFVERLSVFRKALNSGQPELIDWKSSEELFAELFPADSAKVLMESSEIVFIPDDALFVLPFEVLSPHAAAGSFVFLTKATTYYPSAVALRLSRAASQRSTWEKGFLGIADPVTDATDDRFEVAAALGPAAKGPSDQHDGGGDSHPLALDKLKARGFALERLPGTAVEMEAITSLLRAHNQSIDIREGINATKDGLLDTDLSKFRFLHFATHGLLPVDTGIAEPSLVLSYDGVSQSDMFLSMSEILGLKLTSESVVLSACNTGSGQISRTEGVMSLGRAFLAAGSSSVTVSLWQVSDESTALLMKQYYQSLLGGKRKSVGPRKPVSRAPRSTHLRRSIISDFPCRRVFYLRTQQGSHLKRGSRFLMATPVREHRLAGLPD